MAYDANNNYTFVSFPTPNDEVKTYPINDNAKVDDAPVIITETNKRFTKALNRMLAGTRIVLTNSSTYNYGLCTDTSNAFNTLIKEHERFAAWIDTLPGETLQTIVFAKLNGQNGNYGYSWYDGLSNINQSIEGYYLGTNSATTCISNNTQNLISDSATLYLQNFNGDCVYHIPIKDYKGDDTYSGIWDLTLSDKSCLSDMNNYLLAGNDGFEEALNELLSHNDYVMLPELNSYSNSVELYTGTSGNRIKNDLYAPCILYQNNNGAVVYANTNTDICYNVKKINGTFYQLRNLYRLFNIESDDNPTTVSDMDLTFKYGDIFYISASSVVPNENYDPNYNPLLDKSRPNLYVSKCDPESEDYDPTYNPFIVPSTSDAYNYWYERKCDPTQAQYDPTYDPYTDPNSRWNRARAPYLEPTRTQSTYSTIIRKKALIRYLNYVGVPFAFDLNDIQKPVEELPYYNPRQIWIDPNAPKYLTQSITKNEWYAFDGTDYYTVPVTEPTISALDTYGGEIEPTWTESLQEFGDFKVYMYHDTGDLANPSIVTSGTMFTPIHTRNLNVAHQIVSATMTAEQLSDIVILKDGLNYYFNGSEWIQDDKVFTTQEVFNSITEEQWALLGAGIYNIHPILLSAYSSFKSITVSYF